MPRLATLPPTVWTLGFAALGLIALARVAIALDLAVEGRGAERDLALFGIAGRFLPELLNALVLGTVAAGVAVQGVARRDLPRAARLGVLALVALVLALALGGWPAADARDVPLLGASPERSGRVWGLGVPIALAVLGAGLLAGAAALLGARAGLARALGSPIAIALAALLGLGGPLAWTLLEERRAPLMTRSVLARALLLEPEAFAPPAGQEGGAAPRLAVLAAGDGGHDLGDKLALVLAPGEALEFSVGSADGPVRLRAAAGVDRSVEPLEGGRFTLRFEVTRNGELVFDEAREVRPDPDERERRWLHVGGPDGLELQPGDRVGLRTRLEPEGARFAPPDLLCGFGDLVLERTVETARSVADPRRPNILLVVMGNLGAARMSCYGYPKLTTPHADSLARRGMRFEEAFACAPAAAPSSASILSGLDPQQHGVLSDRSSTLLLASESLAEVLQERGFTTGTFSGHPSIHPERSFEKGFETFDFADRMRMSDELVDGVLAWIDRHADVRFFLHLQLVDPRPPQRPLASELARLGGALPDDFPRFDDEGNPLDGMDYYEALRARPENLDERGALRRDLVPPAHREWMRDAYDASVGTGDHHLGLVLERLARLGLDESTLVVFTSDHGGPAPPPTLHREAVRVPLLIAGPGVSAGLRVSQPVSSRHIAPTLAQRAGAELTRVPAPSDLTGDPSGIPARALFSTQEGFWNGNGPEPIYGLREERWVLHWNPLGRPFGAEPGAAPPGGEWRLFDASVDPEERREVSLAEPVRAAELKRSLERELKAWRERHPAAGGAAGTRSGRLPSADPQAQRAAEVTR